jgi:diguanylate cyclase (GGDEF)-like protein
MGRELTENKKKKIAVFANGWSSEYMSLFMEGLRKEAEKDNTDIFVFTTYILPNEALEMKENQLKIFDLAKSMEFDGVIALTHTFNSSYEMEKIQEMFEGSDIPRVSTEVRLPGFSMVGSGNYQGVYELATHLIEKHNVRKVVYIRGNDGNPECAERKKALEDALDEHGLVLIDTLKGDFGFYNASRVVEDWMISGKPIPDAFVCANDLMALGVISILHKYGKDVPGDVIVTGFDHVHEGQTSYPMVATVSRQWDNMGPYAYKEICYQMEHRDPDRETIYPSKFVPSESCGCKPDEEAFNKRLEMVRSVFTNATHVDMIDFFFQKVHIEMSVTESKEDFYEQAKWHFGQQTFFGQNYCICTEPGLFEDEDEVYLEKVKNFSPVLDVIYGRKDGRNLPQKQFSTSEIYPGYVPDPNKSEVYVFASLANMEHLIGYLAIKDNPQVLYSNHYKRWLNNLDTLFINIRHNIFLKKMNAKLREIYMNDFLTDMYNRTGCANVLYKFIEDEKQQGHTSVLLFFDINCMKVINDKFGHLSGDLAIKATANAMKKALPEGFLCGRYGGDEFIAVGSYKGEDVSLYRENFKAELERIKERLQVAFPLSASVGTCIVKPDKDGTVDDFIKEADDSMYEEKEQVHKLLGITSH